MENSLEKRIELLRERGYNLTLGRIVEDSFNHWKKILFFGIFTVLFSYLFSSTINLFLIKFLGTQDIETEFGNSIKKLGNDPAIAQKMMVLLDGYLWNPLIIKKIIFSSLIQLLMFPLGAGVVNCAYQFDKTGTASFKDLISGFHGRKFLNLVGLIFILTVITLASVFLFFIPALYFIPAFILAGAFIVIDDVSLFRAIKCSMQIVNMKFGQVFAVLVVSFFISKVAGIFMCMIGLLFTIPFSYAVVYSIYKNTIGLVTPDEYKPGNDYDDY